MKTRGGSWLRLRGSGSRVSPGTYGAPGGLTAICRHSRKCVVWVQNFTVCRVPCCPCPGPHARSCLLPLPCRMSTKSRHTGLGIETETSHSDLSATQTRDPYPACCYELLGRAMRLLALQCFLRCPLSPSTPGLLYHSPEVPAPLTPASCSLLCLTCTCAESSCRGVENRFGTDAPHEC